MANKPRIIAVLPSIIDEFTKLKKNIFTPADIGQIFETYKDRWRLPLYMDLEQFMDQISKQDFIKEAEVGFERERTQRLFYFDGASIIAIASGLFPNSYISHFSAMSYWGLTEQIPKTVYITREQSNSPVKRLKDELTQEGIDSAFGKEQRQSDSVAELGTSKLVLLKGKSTGNLGTIPLNGNERGRVTDIERTLVDMVVRPSYSGGVGEVLKAYRSVRELHKVSVNRVSGYLSKMDYLYPYHQSIGFFLEAAGFRGPQLEIFDAREKKFDFYLAYDMDEREYSEKWRVWYPKGLL